MLDNENKVRANNKKCQTFFTNAKKILTENQITAITESKKLIKWNSDDVSRAVILRAINQKSYDFWREKIGLPLPSSATLKRWCSRFQCKPGMLLNVLKLKSNVTKCQKVQKRLRIWKDSVL